MATRVQPTDRVDTTYAGDYAAWVEEQVGLLLTGKLTQIDALHIAEELRGLSASDFRSLTSAIANTLTHIAKWEQQPERRSRSWANMIAIQRQHVEQELEHSPSFRSRIDDAVKKAWRESRREASSQTDLPLNIFPQTCPYGWDEIMTRPFEWEADG